MGKARVGDVLQDLGNGTNFCDHVVIVRCLTSLVLTREMHEEFQTGDLFPPLTSCVHSCGLPGSTQTHRAPR